MSWRPVCIVTGAGRGIGRAVAAELAASGYDLVLVARTRQQLDETAQAIGPDRSLVIPADVASEPAVGDVVRQTIAARGRLDAIVNNAGLAPMVPIEQTSPAMWHEVMNVNASSAFYLIHHAWPHLLPRGGAIVNVTSEAVRDPFTGFSAYAAAKAALHMLTVLAHREGKAHGIRAYSVAPAMTDTQMLRQLLGAAPDPHRTLEPRDVARVIASCIVGALRYSSGETVYVHR